MKTFPYIIFFFFTFLIFGNCLDNSFAIDDNLVILENSSVQKGFSGFTEIISSAYLKGKNSYDQEIAFGYRPFPQLIFATLVHCFGNDAFLFHFLSLLLYSACCCVLFFFLTQITNNSALSLFITIIFCIHPIHSEVVNNIKNQEELWACLFGLAGLISIFQHIKTKKTHHLFLGGSLFLLASFCKPTAALYAASCIFLWYIYSQQNYKSILKALLFCSAITLIFRLGFKLIIQDKLDERAYHFIENPSIEFTSMIDKVSFALTTTFVNLKLLIFPSSLNFYYGFNTISLSSIFTVEHLLTLILLLCLVIIFFHFLRKNPLISLGSAILLTGLAATSNLLKIIPGIVAERLLFFPSIGFSILLGTAIYQLIIFVQKKNPSFQKNTLLSFVLVPFLCFSCLINWPRNKVWKNMETLYKTDAEQNPNSVKTQLLLSEFYNDQNQEDLAIEGYTKALTIYPDHHRANAKLAWIYLKRNQAEKAKPLLENALNLHPTNVYSNYYFGYYYHLKNDYKNAAKHYDIAAGKQSDVLDFQVNAGRVNLVLGNLDLALKQTKVGLTHFPESIALHENIINIYYDLNLLEKARPFYQKLQKLDPLKAAEFEHVF